MADGKNTVEAEFRVGIDAWCRDCGAEIVAWEQRLARPVDKPTTFAKSDAGAEIAHIYKAGACEACGGGRAAVCIDIGLS